MVVDPLFNCSKQDVNIKNYILKNYVVAKLPEPYLEVVFSLQEVLPSKSSVDTQENVQLSCANLTWPFARSTPAIVSIKEARILVPQLESHSKNVIELTLNTRALEEIDFLPGDTIGILPENSANDVDFVLEAMQMQDNADASCQVQLKSGCAKKSAKVPPHIPVANTTPRQLLRDCLSLRAVPKKQFLRALSECCSNALEQQFLSCLSSREGSQMYNELILERPCTFLTLLRLCPSCCPSLALLIEQLPRLLPRPYSIVCSPLTNPYEVKIIFSVLPQKPGVCTQMLESLSRQLVEENCHPQLLPNICMYFRESNKFRYTSEEMTHGSILIGVGTGVAPFLGFLEHKLASSTGQLMGKTWLFSGARDKSSAFGRNSFQTYNSSEPAILNRYLEAYSRDAKWPFKYVQDLLLANSEEFVEFLMAPSTRVYVCADGAQISKSIEAGIKQALMQAKSIEDAQAAEIVKGFRACGKYREDLWA